MNKTIMRAAHAILQIIPKSVKRKLKQNEYLTGWYVRSVRRAGLFFDALSPEQTQKLYTDWLVFEQSKKTVLTSAAAEWQVIVFSSGASTAQQATQKAPVFRNDNETCEYFFLHEHDRLDFSSVVQRLNPNIPVVLINEGDELTPEAKQHFLRALQSADLVYSDTDSLSENGDRKDPRFLPDWNPDLMYSTAYVKSGVVIMPELLKKIENEDAQTISGIVVNLWFDNKLMRIHHIPLPLVHTNCEADITQQELECVKDSINRHTSAEVTYNQKLKLNQIRWQNSKPLVSLLIPTKNSKALVKACIESILDKTTYSNFEILLIDNGSDEKESLDYFAYLNTLEKVRVLKYPHPFNYSAINNFGVKHAAGSIIGLINNDIEVISPDWLLYMVGHAERDSVGCVGAKLLYSDTRIQHAGVVLGYGGGAGHAHKNFPRYYNGHLNRINATGNFSAVTAACLLVKRVVFETVGGLNEKDLAVAFNDVDFCLKVRELGLQNVYCAEAELFHHESVSRGLDISPEKAARFNRELNYLQTKWHQYIKRDPAYSPNLTLKRENFAVKGMDELIEDALAEDNL